MGRENCKTNGRRVGRLESSQTAIVKAMDSSDQRNETIPDIIHKGNDVACGVISPDAATSSEPHPHHIVKTRIHTHRF
jgi:hypothetical protein